MREIYWTTSRPCPNRTAGRPLVGLRSRLGDSVTQRGLPLAEEVSPLRSRTVVSSAAAWVLGRKVGTKVEGPVTSNLHELMTEVLEIGG